MKYVDAEKLKKAIEDKGLDCSFALKMERLNTLALIDELQQEQPSLPDNLDEAAKTFCDTLEGKEAWSYGPDHYDWGDVNNAFIAGAEWQYQKDRGEFAKLKVKEWINGYDEGYAKGLNARKEE